MKDATRRQEPHVLEKELTNTIIGAFYAVYNALGYGFLESVYARSLLLELRRRGIRALREVGVDVYYLGEPVGRFRTDLIVESRVIVEVKGGQSLGRTDREQLLNYLRCSNLEVGLLMHFGPRPAFQRVVAENARRRHSAVSASFASS
ncbi:MAG TPA: GxxExxY protein [Gemmatimonadaceae bacterium]|nr:GxxExxY protein [Gemmatimonadaceae bacterium]